MEAVAQILITVTLIVMAAVAEEVDNIKNIPKVITAHEVFWVNYKRIRLLPAVVYMRRLMEFITIIDKTVRVQMVP